MKRSKKVALCILLGLGVVTAISGTIRASYLPELNHRHDITWETFNLFAWVSIEIFLLIVLGSLPALKPLYDTYLSALPKRLKSPSTITSHETKPDTPPYQPVSSQSTDIKFVPRQPSKAHLGNATFEDSDIHVERTFELDVTLRDSLRNSKDTTSQGAAEERREVTGHDLV
ncbi:MAG: hypothetical protein Q9223_001712 [Gallowayella weberi]